MVVVRETPSLADSVEELLLSEGYQVRRASSGLDAREMLARRHRNPIEAVVVVCNEPICSNLDSIAVLGLSTPVIVLGWRGPSLAGLVNHRVTFLRLPISAGQLLEELRVARNQTPTVDPSASTRGPPGHLPHPIAHPL